MEQIKFLLEHDLRVACDTAGVLIRCPIRFVQCGDLHRRNAADHARESFRGCAQDIDIGVVNGLRKSGRTREEIGLLGFLAGAEGGGDL